MNNCSTSCPLSGLKKILIGSSTEKVIGHAGCAVLNVKGKDSKPATV